MRRMRMRTRWMVLGVLLLAACGNDEATQLADGATQPVGAQPVVGSIACVNFIGRIAFAAPRPQWCHLHLSGSDGKGGLYVSTHFEHLALPVRLTVNGDEVAPTVYKAADGDWYGDVMSWDGMQATPGIALYTTPADEVVHTGPVSCAWFACDGTTTVQPAPNPIHPW